MIRRPLALAVLSLLSFALSACCDSCDDEYYPAPPEAVSIEVEVYDPVTGGVWEGVGVRLASAWQEWSGCVCDSPFTDSFELTDMAGRVHFSAYDVHSYAIGFPVDSYGRAVLGSHPAGDDATVPLEVWAPGFNSVFVRVDVSWSWPDALISVPFH